MGKVTTTEPAIKYCLGVSASPVKWLIALDKVNDFGLSKNIKENKNSFQAIIKTYRATDEMAGILNGIIILKITPNQFRPSIIPASSSSQLRHKPNYSHIPEAILPIITAQNLYGFKIK